MLRKKLIVFVVLMIIIILILTNPSKEQYKRNFLMYDTTSEPKDKATRDHLSQTIDDYSLRKNYLIFSIYEFNYQVEKSDTYYKKYLAIFNNFYKIANKTGNEN
jgi:hypothetical protein